MNLRTQMLLAGALTLAVPVIGWQSVKQLNESLRQTRVDAQSLKVANARLALAESDNLRAVLQSSRTDAQAFDLYAEKANFPMFVDGYEDEWQNLQAPPLRFGTGKNALSLRLATNNNRLFLFFNVQDANVVYHKPPALSIDRPEIDYVDEQSFLSNGDAIEIVVGEPSQQSEHVLFRSIAPGPVTGLNASSSQNQFHRQTGRGGRTQNNALGAKRPAYTGYWVATSNGFQLELSMPLPPPATPLGIAFIDVDESGTRQNQWLGTLSPEHMPKVKQGESGEEVGRLYYASATADARLSPWVTLGTRARLFDRQGRLLSDINALYEKTAEEFEYDPAERGFLNAVLFRIFSYFVADAEVGEQPFSLNAGLHLPANDVDTLAEQVSETRHYVTTERDHVLGTLVAIGGDEPNGFLLFESNEDLASAYSASRVARLFSLLTLVSLLAGLVLLVYASILSMRIRSLSRLATRAVADDGRVRGLPHSDARDEIGDLSRNLSALLERSANYTKYLEALSSRLSHELRTPLSVVKTSIENMDRDKLDAETVVLMDRASGGADQLGAIIRALVESTRLEQTVQRAQMQSIDMLEWFRGSLERYKQVYPDASITARVNHASGTPAGLKAEAAEELLQQALDKLVDNAIAFSNDGNVALLLESYSNSNQPMIAISVHNNGNPIPEHDHAQLFDPMFSNRSGHDGELHLGLGLYIVRMISEAHHGHAWVRNTASGVTVGFSIPIPNRL